MAKRRNPAKRYADQAALEALVRFGPELSGLAELQRTAQGNYATGVAQAKQTAAGITSAARAARPEIVHVYNRAGGRLTQTDRMVADDLAALGPGAQAIRTAAAVESGASRSRLREARANSVRDLAERRVQAQTGRAYAVQNARRELVSDLGKVQRRRADVLRERGAFTASTLGDLLQTDLDRRTRIAIEKMGARTRLKITQAGLNASERRSQRAAQQSERNSLRSSGIDPNTGKPIPGGKLDPKVIARGGGGGGGGAGGKGWATQVQHARAKDAVDLARHWVTLLHNGGAPGDAIVHGLTEGRDAKPLYKTVKDPRTGRTHQVRVLEKDGTPATTREIPKIGSSLLVKAALEAEFQGYVSRGTQRQLHRRGLRLSILGLPTYQSGARKRRRQRSDFNTAINNSPGGDAAQR